MNYSLTLSYDFYYILCVFVVLIGHFRLFHFISNFFLTSKPGWSGKREILNNIMLISYVVSKDSKNWFQTLYTSSNEQGCFWWTSKNKKLQFFFVPLKWIWFTIYKRFSFNYLLKIDIVIPSKIDCWLQLRIKMFIV